MKKFSISLILISILALPLITMAINTLPNPNVDVVVKNIGDVLFYILLAGAVIAILISAFQFITASGDPEKVATARNYLIYALIGIVVAILARGIVDFISTNIGKSS